MAKSSCLYTQTDDVTLNSQNHVAIGLWAANLSITITIILLRCLSVSRLFTPPPKTGLYIRRLHKFLLTSLTYSLSTFTQLPTYCDHRNLVPKLQILHFQLNTDLRLPIHLFHTSLVFYQKCKSAFYHSRKLVCKFL